MITDKKSYKLYCRADRLANLTIDKRVLIPDVIIGGTPAIILKDQTEVWWVKSRLYLDK